jgi:hypothetical protein
MKHLPRLGALALVLTLTTAACGESNRRPINYPGSSRGSVGERDNRGNGNSARPNKNKGRRDEARCNAGRGNGNGNGRCRNGNRGRGNNE